MKVGLTLGKYAPFHAGHQRLIEIALAEMDHLIVVVYNAPEATQIPLEIRAGWIRALYPGVEVREAWDGPTEIGRTDGIKKKHEDYLKKKIGDRRIAAFYSGEFYGKHISRALKADNRKIDRRAVDISGTMIRDNPFKYKSYLDPLVYKDFVLNIAFLGAPSTGKTTLCENLAELYGTVWMPEFGREFWEKNQKNRRLSREQLVQIAKNHILKEEELIAGADRYIFIDTNAITTYMFGKYYHGAASDELKSVASEAEKRYDLFFLCQDDIPYEDTWDRSGELNRSWFQYQIESDLKTRRIPFIILEGSLDNRIQRVRSILSGLKKFDSISNHLLGVKPWNRS